MSYSGVVLLAFVIFLIINYDIILKRRKDFKIIIPALKEYRRFLCSVLIFFGADAIWGILEKAKMLNILYIDTMIFFALMAFDVFLWTRYSIALIKEKNIFNRILNISGWLFLMYEWIVVIINIFWPILFYFDENKQYQSGQARHATMYIQIAMFLMTTGYMFYSAYKTKEDRARLRMMAIGMFGMVMTVFIGLQVFYPMLPLYSVGYIIGTCLLHTFVLEGSKRAQVKQLKELLSTETRQRMELIEAREKANTDPLTGVKSKHAYVETEMDIDRKIASGEQKEFGIVVFDVNGLKYVNDHFGHDAGDKYLKDACSMICNQFKHSAVFRIGGDEFVALLIGTDYNNRDSLISDFDRQCEENISKKAVVVSTGFDLFNPKQDNAINSIFVRADKKMYERKALLKEMGSI